MLYPLKFKPILKPKIWGGNQLQSIYRHGDKKLKNIGESWDVSTMPDNLSEIVNGFLAENTLDEIIETYLGNLVGDKIYDKFGNFFPLLVKLIDASQNLSIQVHPNDQLAYERHQSLGKTEMWYVLDAAPEAFLISGFNKPIDKTEYLQRVADNTLEEVLQKIPVTKGDVVYTPAGCVHAIGKGCLILEIQEASDVTYRIYDYNRLQDNGLPRELQTDLAVDAIDFEHWKKDKIVPELVMNQWKGVVDCEYFTTGLIKFDKKIEFDLAPIDSFFMVTCVDGSCKIKYDEDKFETAVKGETLLVPAELNSLELEPDGMAELMTVYIKNKNTDNNSN